MELEQFLPSPVKTNLSAHQEGTLHVSVTKRTVGQEPVELLNETTRIMETEAIKNPAYVGVSPRFTKNLGNYESLQIGIICVLPCKPTQEDIDATFAKVSDLAVREMEKNLSAFVG
jgi:hypothetical protein